MSTKTTTPSSGTNPPENYKTDEVMRRLRYDDTAAFFSAMRAAGAPMTIINARRILFPAKSFDAWLQSRTTGGHAA